MQRASRLVGDESRVLRESDFQLLLLANLLPPLGAALVSPILDSLTEPLGVSPASIGLMMSAFTAPPIVMIPLSGILADRFGRKPILVAGLLLFGGAGTAIAFTADFRTILALRVVQGIGFAGLTPVIITSIGDLYEDATHATAEGLRFSGSGFTQALFPLLSGGLVSVGWQYPFLLYAIAFPIAGLVFLRFDEPSGVSHSRDDESAGATVRELLDHLAHRHVKAILLARGFPMFVWIGFLTYNSILVAEFLAGSPWQAAVLTSASAVSYAISATQAGRITALFPNWRNPLVVANVGLGAGFGVLLLSSVFPLAVGGAVLLGSGFGLTLSLYRNVIIRLSPPRLRGSLVSLAEAIGRFASTLAPVVMGLFIGIATPLIGFSSAIRTVGLGITGLAIVGAVLSLAVASTTAPPVE